MRVGRNVKRLSIESEVAGSIEHISIYSLSQRVEGNLVHLDQPFILGWTIDAAQHDEVANKVVLPVKIEAAAQEVNQFFGILLQAHSFALDS